MTTTTLVGRRRAWLWVVGLLAVWGPGIIVMLADTDAGSIITASQSGAQWGYAMVLPQLVLIPVLFVVQEMTVRLGILTGEGHGALIRRQFGARWALISSITLVCSVVGALVSEFAAIALVGELFGISRWVTIPIATTVLIAAALGGSYRRTERIGIAVGMAELAFIPAMLMARPDAHSFGHGLSTLPVGHSAYLFLLAANVGAVIMPWMIFYQQGAVIDKRLPVTAMRRARQDTAVGAVLTQLIMIAVVVILAATIGRQHLPVSLNTAGQISGALTPFLGVVGAKVLFGAGLLGAALVAALVASLAGAWGLAEVFGWGHSLNGGVSRDNARFYLVYVLAHVLGAVVVLASLDLVSLAVDVEVMNALLLPIVLGFLLALEARALPKRYRMRGAHRLATTALCVAVIGFGLFMVPTLIGT